MKNNILISLQKIVGIDFVSDRIEELYLYSRDLGSGNPGQVDYLVMPGTAEEIRQILEMACREKISITPIGAGLNLSGLTIPNRGGIALDMRRMDNILEVNETSRYVIVEPGVTTGKLISHLTQNYPGLRFSVPDAPPTATITGNVLYNGSGYLSKYGIHSEMINGLEVVLPNAEICRLGSCSLSPYWFSRSPLPDLIGLFVNWFGTTGIITKLSLKLYPRHKIRDMIFFVLPDYRTIAHALQVLSSTEFFEDILVLIYRMPESQRIANIMAVYITAGSQTEFELKKKLCEELLLGLYTGYKKILSISKEMFPSDFIANYLSEPKSDMQLADQKKGGGLEYLGVNFPLDVISKAYQEGYAIAEKYGFDSPVFTIRNIGIGQSVIFTFVYPFNRADKTSMENCRNALFETTKMALNIGGVPWKPTIKEQKLIMEKMNRETLNLMKKIKKTLDPNGIMNPGHWEIR